jgi:hypothetical protein
MLIDTEDRALTRRERDALRTIGARLARLKTNPEQMLPATYRAEIDRVFGSCADGDLEARGTP